MRHHVTTWERAAPPSGLTKNGHFVPEQTTHSVLGGAESVEQGRRDLEQQLLVFGAQGVDHLS